MSAIGYGVGGAVGIAEEVTEGTPVDPTYTLPFVTESMKAERPPVETGTITGDRQAPEPLDGVRSGAGDLLIEVDGANNLLLANWMNGKQTGALTTANMPGKITAAPTVTPASGGTLAPGAYRYRLASVWQRTATGEKYVCEAGTAVIGTTASTDLTITVDGWTIPTGQPSGFTHVGTAIYRSAIDGLANSEKFLAYVAGATVTYSDTGSVTLGTKLPVLPAATQKQHTLVSAFATGTPPLQAFTTTINRDNDAAVQFSLCRVKTWELNSGANGTVITNKVGILARDWDLVSNFSTAVTDLRKMMAWGNTISLDGTANETIEAFNVQVDNGCELLDGYSGLPRKRDVGYGRRAITGSLNRGYEDQTFLRKLRAATRFSMDCWMLGGPIVTTDSEITIGSGITARPIPYMMRVNIPHATINSAGANIGGPGRMVENIPWKASKDPTTGVDMSLYLYNLTASA